MTLSINEILPNNLTQLYQMLMDITSTNLRVGCPGIIQSFNANEQTVTVQPSVRERVQDPTTKEYSWVPLPLLVDVPLMVQRGGGYALTLPVSEGDECFVVFGDMCIDAWWANGGVQNQAEKRRHDLSDGFAILAPTSQPKTLSNYSTTSAQLRTEDGSQYIDLSSNGFTIKGNLTVDGSINATGTITGGS